MVRSRALLRTISCLPCHLPSHSEVITPTDSSKASLLFFCESSFVTRDEPVSLGATHLTKGRSYNLSMPFPLVKLRRQNIAPKKTEQLVSLYRFREFMTRAEHRLLSIIPNFSQFEGALRCLLTLIAWASAIKKPARGVGHNAT